MTCDQCGERAPLQSVRVDHVKQLLCATYTWRQHEHDERRDGLIGPGTAGFPTDDDTAWEL